MISREARIPEDILKKYYKKTGDRDISKEGELITTERGFVVIQVDLKEKALFIIQGYGDADYWEKYLKNLAKQRGLKKIYFYTSRNGKALERRFKGLKIKGYLMEYVLDE